MPQAEWHPGGLYLRVGFIVTKLSRPVERVVAFYGRRGRASNGQRRQERDQVDAPVMLLVRCQRGASLVARAGLQFRQLHADAGPARGGRAVVTDQPAGEAREGRCQGLAPRSPCRLPDGRGRGAERTVQANIATDRRTATTTGPSVGLNGRRHHHHGWSASE